MLIKKEVYILVWTIYNCDNVRKLELLLIFLGRSGESQTRSFVIAKTPNDLSEEK